MLVRNLRHCWGLSSSTLVLEPSEQLVVLDADSPTEAAAVGKQDGDSEKGDKQRALSLQDCCATTEKQETEALSLPLQQTTAQLLDGATSCSFFRSEG